MHLEIITPEKEIFSGEVEAATFPGSNGSFQVLDNHAALISSLSKGLVKYKTQSTEHSLMVNGGVVEVLHNNVILLAEQVIESDEG